jgi:hypothetical protein
MAMTEHRNVGTVLGYFQAGAMLESSATRLLMEPGISRTLKGGEP